MRTLSLLTLLALAALCLSDLAGMCPPGSFLWVTTLQKVSRSALGWQRGRDKTRGRQQGGNRTNYTLCSTDAKPSGPESDKGTGRKPGRASASAPTLSPKPPDPLAFCLGVPTFPPKPRIT